jgi:tricorn protease
MNNLFARIESINGEPQNIKTIFATEDHLYALYNDTLWALKRSDSDKEWKELYKDVKKAKITDNKKHILLVDKETKYHIVPASGEKVEKKKTVDLQDRKILVSPKLEWKQRFEEAWRNQRDLFYDPNMHGIDWNEMKKKYLPHLELVTSNEELNDLLEQMVGELGALHHFVRNGDSKKSDPEINQGYLGATFEKCEKGFRIETICETHLDNLSMQSPLRTFDQKFKVGDVIVKINGRTWNTIEEALLEMKNKNVSLTLMNGKTHEVQTHDRDKEVALLHYQWVHQNRQKVSAKSQDQLGYVQMRDMGSNGINDFSSQFYSQLDKKGIILDLRKNTGGNIDHLILEKLLKKSWMQLKDGHGVYKNMMVDSFDGPLLALCDSTSYSDAESFLLAFKTLKLGIVIGNRTWGGGIWLNSTYGKGIDHGLTTIPNWGSYDKNGELLIENKGVEPDIWVKNDPKEEYEGHDAVLEAGIQELLYYIK